MSKIVKNKISKDTKDIKNDTNTIDDIESVLPELLENPAEYANKVPLETLVEVLRKLSYHYYNTSDPLVPDDIYDLLREILEERDPTNLLLKQVGSPVASKDAVQLPYPMSSLDKIKPDTNALENWKKTYPGPYVISDKLDGISGLLYKDDTGKLKLFTRGDSTTGQDISHLIPYLIEKKHLDSIPKNVAVRGEIIMSKKNFDTIKDKYKNARNTVGGLVNSKHYSIDIAKLTEFIGYAVIVVNQNLSIKDQMNKLILWKFPMVLHKVLTKIDNDDLSKYLQERRTNSEYDVDGLVVSDSSKPYPVTATTPDSGFAFKMILSDQIAETIVLNVEWTITMYGYLKPVLKLKPINLKGVTIKNATAYNAKYIVDNLLGPGAVVKIIRSGDVIPKVLKVIKPATTGKPKYPDVAYKWNDTKVDLIVQDVHGASKDAITIRQITHFFKIMDVKYISEGIITKLVENSYNTIPKILNADKNKLTKIEGFGEKLISKIFTNIINAFDIVNLEILMAASGTFGIGLGRKKLKIIVNAIPDIMVKDKKWDKKILKELIMKLPGFDTTTTSRFVENFHKFLNFFKELEAIDTIAVSQLRIAPEKSDDDNDNEEEDKIFDGEVIVFSGYRNDDWERYIGKNGGAIGSSVSKNTTLLVYTDADTAKYTKAKDLGIKMMTVQEFKDKYKLI